MVVGKGMQAVTWESSRGDFIGRKHLSYVLMEELGLDEL